MVSSSEYRSIEISLVLTGEALLGYKVGKPCKRFFLGWEQTVCGWKTCKCHCWHWKVPSWWTPQACNVPFWNNQRAGDQFEEIIPCWVGTVIIFDIISLLSTFISRLFQTNFMTIVVRFQLIFLMKIKYISFRDLSPNRPFQELFQTRAGFIFLSDSPSTRLGLGHITFVCIFCLFLEKFGSFLFCLLPLRKI